MRRQVLRTPGRTCRETFVLFLCDRDGQTFCDYFSFSSNVRMCYQKIRKMTHEPQQSVTMKIQECSFRDAESHKERDDGAYLCKETFNLCWTIYKVTSLIPPLSKRCQGPRRLRVVGTYLQGEEGKGNFFKTRRMPRSSRRSTGQPV